MTHDPVVMFSVITIAVVLAVAWLRLNSERSKEQASREYAEYEAQREQYLNWLRSKYAGEQPHGYRARKHIDFTGEEPLSAVRLAEIKKEVLR